MPNIIVCYKSVMDEQDIMIKSENQDLDFSRAKRKISDYDKNAIEEAIKMQENYGGKVAALTFGSTEAKQSLKECLARGPEQVYFVNDSDAEKADSFVTANVLSAALKKIGSYDVILCGEGSADTYAQQVGPRLAALLNIPGITFVSKIQIESDKVIATRKVGNCTEVVAASLPVVISVNPDINVPRIPSLKQVLTASKKPVTEWKVDDLEVKQEELKPKNIVKSIKGYVMNRKKKILQGTPEEQVAMLIAYLAKEGVL